MFILIGSHVGHFGDGNQTVCPMVKKINHGLPLHQNNANGVYTYICISYDSLVTLRLKKNCQRTKNQTSHIFNKILFWYLLWKVSETFCRQNSRSFLWRCLPSCIAYFDFEKYVFVWVEVNFILYFKSNSLRVFYIINFKYIPLPWTGLSLILHI
jgi:hypothetical protein